MPTIAIIGGGLSGALVAYQLLRRGPKGMSIALVESRDKIGLGQAYSTRQPDHLLNIPAGRMSSLPERPTAFADYLAGRSDVQTGDVPIAEFYAPRHVFGDFTTGLVQEAISAGVGPKLRRVQGTVVAVERGDRHVVILSDGRQIIADTVVLALGNPPPRHPEGGGSWLQESSFYQHDPCRPDAFDEIGANTGILFLGTGLTMIDCVLTLRRRGHRGPMVAVSRHGLLPQPHTQGPRTARELPFDPDRPPGMASLLHAVRRRARQAEAGGHDWRGVMDGLRAAAEVTWRHMPHDQQARFLRHVRPWWEIHRHRVAPAVWAKISPLLASGQLRIVAARVRRYRPSEGGIEITAARRHTRDEIHLRGGLLVNCTGPNMDLDTVDDPLLRQLSDSGAIAPGPHRLGIDVNDELSAIGLDGTAQAGLYALGSMLRGRYWETTAVPEIGRQAADLAAILVRRHTLAA